MTGIETEIEQGEDMEVAVVPTAVPGAVHAVVVGAVGVAAEAIAGTGVETERGVVVPETDEMIDQASLRQTALPLQLVLLGIRTAIFLPPPPVTHFHDVHLPWGTA